MVSLAFTLQSCGLKQGCDHLEFHLTIASSKIHVRSGKTLWNYSALEVKKIIYVFSVYLSISKNSEVLEQKVIMKHQASPK